MLAKTQNVILLDLSGSQGMSIARTHTVRLESTSAEPLEKSLALVSLNQVENYWKMTPTGCDLLNLTLFKVGSEYKIFNQKLGLSYTTIVNFTIFLTYLE